MKRVIFCLIPIVLLLAGCWWSTPSTTREEPVPAALEAERLRATEPPASAEVRELRTQELAAETAAAKASAAGDQPQAEYQRRLGEALARLRTAAEQREQDQRKQIEALAVEADRRAVAERSEMDRRAVAAQKADEQHQADEQRLSDRRWAGFGLALAVAAGIALRLLGLPTLISGGIPAALGAGCLTLAAWSSVPWLAPVLGLVLAGGLLVGVAIVARHLGAEWVDYARRLGAVHPLGKAEADAASLIRQPAWLRWVLDHVLKRHAVASPAAAASTSAASTASQAPA